MTDDAATPDDVHTTAIKLALERAHTIHDLLSGAALPVDRTTILALAMVAASSAQQYGLSANDAFAIYLAVFEGFDQTENERIASMFDHLKNSLHDLVRRGTLNQTKSSTH